MGPGRFRIDPNPPLAGREAKVTYEGDARTVEYQVDDGPPVKKSVPPPDFVINPVPDGRVLIIVDGSGEPGSGLVVPIDQTFRTPAPPSTPRR